MFVALLLAHSLTVPQAVELRGEPLMAELRRGGYTVILRHARTDRSFQEVREYVPKERNAQRNLTDDGIRDAALMGVVFRKYGITFAEIVSSPMFRTVETAEMAAGKPTSVTMDLRAIPSTPAQATLIAHAPAAGTNRLLVTHHFVIETHVPGIRPGEIGESEAVVVRPTDDGKVTLVGRITLDDWRLLASPAGSMARESPAATPAGVGGVSHAGAAIAHTPSAGGAPAIPDTHAGHLAREYIAAFNSGNRERMRSYIESYMVANPERPIEQRLEQYMKLFEEHGPLSVLMIGSSQSTELTLSARSRRGGLRLTVRSSEAQPMRASSVTFAHTEGSHP
jgi:phosphohistidine phosphatase SixA